MKVGEWILLSYYENTISEKYSHYVDILKHVEIIKFQATNTNDMSLHSLLKIKYTLKFSILYLLTFSRKLTKTENVDILKHVEIIKFQVTNTSKTSLDSSIKTKFTLKILVLYLLPFSRN